MQEHAFLSRLLVAAVLWRAKTGGPSRIFLGCTIVPQSLPPSLRSALLNQALDQTHLSIAQVCQLRWLQSHVAGKQNQQEEHPMVTAATCHLDHACLHLCGTCSECKCIVGQSEVPGYVVHGGCPPYVRLHAAPHIQRRERISAPSSSGACEQRLHLLCSGLRSS
jgi:hypothetical protein